MDCIGISAPIGSYDYQELAKFGIAKVEGRSVTWRSILKNKIETEELFQATQNHLSELLTKLSCNLAPSKEKEEQKKNTFKAAYMAFLRLKAIEERRSTTRFRLSRHLELPEELLKIGLEQFGQKNEAAHSQEERFLARQLQSCIALCVNPDKSAPMTVRLREANLALIAGVWSRCLTLIIEEKTSSGKKNREAIDEIIKRIDREIKICYDREPYVSLSYFKEEKNESATLKESSEKVNEFLTSNLIELIKKNKINLIERSKKRTMIFFFENIPMWLKLAHQVEPLYLPSYGENKPCYSLNSRDLQVYLINQAFRLSDGRFARELRLLLNRVYDNGIIEPEVYSAVSKKMHQLPHPIDLGRGTDHKKEMKKICEIIKNSNPNELQIDDRINCRYLIFEFNRDAEQATIYFYFKEKKEKNQRHQFIGDHSLYACDIEDIGKPFYKSEIKPIQMALNMEAFKAYQEESDIVWWQRLS